MNWRKFNFSMVRDSSVNPTPWCFFMRKISHVTFFIRSGMNFISLGSESFSFLNNSSLLRIVAYQNRSWFTELHKMTKSSHSGAQLTVLWKCTNIVTFRMFLLVFNRCRDSPDPIFVSVLRIWITELELKRGLSWNINFAPKNPKSN